MLTIITVLKIIIEKKWECENEMKQHLVWKSSFFLKCLTQLVHMYVLHIADFGSVEDKGHCRGESQIQC